MTIHRNPCAPRRRPLARAVAALATGLGGCAQLPPPILPPVEPSARAIADAGSITPEQSAFAASAAGEGGPTFNAERKNTRLFKTPPPPREGRAEALPSPAGTPAPEDRTLETAVNLEQLPLPLFIDTVFASILKRNISVDPSIAQRKELVSLKSGKPQTATGLYDAAKSVLKSFGIAVIEYDGLVRFTPASGTTGFVPELRRGRSLPDVPAALRPVFQIVDLQAVSPGNIIGWLRTVFGQRLQFQDDLAGQAIVVSGQSDDVAAAVEAIKVLDQPVMRGRSSARIAPLFWSADEMSKRLSEVLQAQGYSVGTAAQSQAPIILLAVPPLNSVIVFARNDEILNYTLRWATELDQPASGRGSAGYFTYPVRNLDAGELAKTLQEVMNPAGGTAAASGATRSRVVVNASSNTLIIQGSPTEYQQWFGLLQELDRPPRSALVTVTIAEVRLNNGEQLGFEWMLNQFQSGGYDVKTSTMGAFGTAAIGGLSAVVTAVGNSTPRALLNALASTSKVRVLANPSVMARNGEQASIQVGSEVPVVSSQQTTGTTTATSSSSGTNLQTGILQTIQYRSTGVILKVKPVIHAGGRIDLDVEQEVSSASATQSGVTASPTIATRRIATKLTVTDGATVLLGGLMQETANSSDTGVPILKDIPFVGNLFKSRNDTRDRTELVILITPYVIDDEFEARSITDAFRHQYTWDSTTSAQTLRPPHASTIASPPQTAGGNAPKEQPYILPPVNENKPDEKENTTTRHTPTNPIVQTRPNFGASAASAPAGSASSPAQAPASRPAVEGKAITDPQVLKDLQNLIKKP